MANLAALTKKDLICARLARLVGRAYYDEITVIVLDAVIYLDRTNTKRVLEKEVSDRLNLGAKQTREILQRLRKDQIIASSHVRDDKEEDEFAPTPSRRQRAFARATAQQYYYMSYETLCKVIKVKHSIMMKRMEAKADKSEAFYICPNKTVCPVGKAGTKYPLMDLLLGLHLTTDNSEALVAAAAGKTAAASLTAGGMGKTTDFACPKCKTMRNGVLGPTILVLTAESQQQLGSAGSNLISRFNSQLKEIMSALSAAEQEIKQAIKDEQELKADQDYKTALGIPLNTNKPVTAVKLESKTNLNNVTISVSTGNKNIASTPSIKLESKPPLKSEYIKQETRHLPNTANVVVNTVQHEFKAVPQLHRKPLPWMKTESLLALEEQKKHAESLEQKRVETERRRQEEEKRQFDSIFAHEMSRMARMEISLPPAYDANRSVLLYPDVDDSGLPTLLVNGEPVRCSQLTQSHLDRMSPSEFQTYTSLFCSPMDVLDPDATGPDPADI